MKILIVKVGVKNLMYEVTLLVKYLYFLIYDFYTWMYSYTLIEFNLKLNYNDHSIGKLFLA